ncbi:DoxX family protein [Pedobacter sp. SD-b]|uniref:DoxX family protein n=1 Tax=Pedobacter segetis TaxID=2793069 RepID=A0ABS1BIW6_9SPHI|nr:DoxX family protein [Pedobacter segetis]MBK0382301.1 DoxX family protein [Pedobacter segetis]
MKTSIKTKILFVLSFLFGLMFINAGLNKFFNYMPMPKNLPEKMMKAMGAFMEIGWILPLVGIAEIIGGFLIIIPRTRALGALIIFPIMVGIFLTNIYQDSSGLPIAIILGAILVWIMIENRKKYLPLISR